MLPPSCSAVAGDQKQPFSGILRTLFNLFSQLPNASKKGKGVKRFGSRKELYADLGL
jgi:hypothetical protein